MSRRGFTLIELLLTLLILGMLALLGGVRIAAVRDSLVLRQEVERLVGALETARGTALRLGMPVALTLTDTLYLVRGRDAAGDSITLWRSPGSERELVLLSGAGPSILFGPSGVAMGAANRTITLRRGSRQRQVVISRLGRITSKSAS